MSPARALILSHRRALAVLLALTLAVKALIPAGFMPDSPAGFMPNSNAARVFTVRLCGDSAARVLPIITRADGQGKSAPSHSHPEPPCGFAALGQALVGGAAPALCAAPMGFALVLAMAARANPPRAPRAFLRPPLRAPPPQR